MPRQRNQSELLQGMSVFVEVGQSRSFTAAAQKLGMSTSGVSRSIARMEERLGVRLIYRTTRNTSLTADGARHLERCREILGEIEEAENDLRYNGTEPKGRLRLRLPRGFGRSIIMPTLTKFMTRYPKVVLDISFDGGGIDLVETGIDIAMRIGAPSQSRLIAKKLRPIHYYICAAPRYLKENGTPASIDDLLAHRCLVYQQPRTGILREWQLRKSTRQIIAPVVPAMIINDVNMLVEAAIAGAGIAYLPDFMITDHILERRLSLVLPDLAFEGTPIYIVYLPNRYRSERVRLLVDFLLEAVAANSALPEIEARPKKTPRAPDRPLPAKTAKLR